jgi:hypothetical protein
VSVGRRTSGQQRIENLQRKLQNMRVQHDFLFGIFPTAEVAKTLARAGKSRCGTRAPEESEQSERKQRMYRGAVDRKREYDWRIRQCFSK